MTNPNCRIYIDGIEKNIDRYWPGSPAANAHGGAGYYVLGNGPFETWHEAREMGDFIAPDLAWTSPSIERSWRAGAFTPAPSTQPLEESIPNAS